MKPIETIVKALAAGAVAKFEPNAFGVEHDRVVDAYLDLKAHLQRKYSEVDVDLIEIGPGSTERQDELAEQMSEASVAEDEEVLGHAQSLLDIIAEEDPEALWASEEAEQPPHLK